MSSYRPTSLIRRMFSQSALRSDRYRLPFRFTIQSEFAISRIAYSRPHVVTLKFSTSFRGRYQDRVEFTFEDVSLQKRFAIVRDIRGIGGEQSEYEALRPTAPYVPRKWQARTQESNIIPGVKPPALDAIPWVVPLPEAAVPRALADTVSTGAIKDILARLKSSFFLLWIEEVRMENDLRIYDLDAAVLQSNEFFHL
jgi:helicase MOV-10